MITGCEVLVDVAAFSQGPRHCFDVPNTAAATPCLGGQQEARRVHWSPFSQPLSAVAQSGTFSFVSSLTRTEVRPPRCHVGFGQSNCCLKIFAR